MIEIEIKGIPEAIKKLGWFALKEADAVDKAVLNAANNIIVPKAKAFAPVDTGKLRDSIRAEKIGFKTAVVKSDVLYAIYQEYGFHHWKSGKFIPGKFFITNAINESITEIRDYIVNIIKNII